MDEITWEDRGKAALMPLRGGPKSAEAEAFVEWLVRTVAPASALARPSFVERYRKAIGAFVADLLSVAARGRGGKRTMSANDFSLRENGFGYEVFKRVKDEFLALDLIEFKNGWKRVTKNAFETPGWDTRTGGDYAFFRATPLLLELAREHGALPFQEHWRAGKLPKTSNAPILELRAAKRAGQRQGDLLPYDEADSLTAYLLRDLEQMNAFIHEAEIGGITFGGWKRVFNDGDVPGKRFRRGGRFYSRRGSDPYERMDGETRRALITINGESVAEVDISACHLTILYGLKRAAFDAAAEDPYGPEETRLPVKLYVASVFGKGHTDATYWSPQSGIAYAKERPGRSLRKDFAFAEIRQLALERHPILCQLSASALKALDLQFHESEIIRLAMMFLRNEGVHALPVHDSLLVPVSKANEAIDAIEKGFLFHLEGAPVKPRMKLKLPSGLRSD